MVKIHAELAHGSYPNCSRLADILEVSPKTVQRDVDFMRDQLLLPIEYDAVQHGFYYTQPVDKFPLLNVSQGELVALLVAQKAAEQYRGTPFEKPLRSALDKLAASLDEKTNVSLHALSEAVSFRATGATTAQVQSYDALANAVMQKNVVTFDYQGMKDTQPVRRQVEPLHLVCIDSQWYLVAHDRMRNARRTFALPRISRVRTTQETFEHPADFSLSEMLEGGFAFFEGHKIERVVMEFDATVARLVAERKWHPTQKIEWLSAGCLRITLDVALAPDLEKWILGWGSHAEVIEPLALRSRIKSEAHAMVKRY